VQGTEARLRAGGRGSPGDRFTQMRTARPRPLLWEPQVRGRTVKSREGRQEACRHSGAEGVETAAGPAEASGGRGAPGLHCRYVVTRLTVTRFTACDRSRCKGFSRGMHRQSPSKKQPFACAAHVPATGQARVRGGKGLPRLRHAWLVSDASRCILRDVGQPMSPKHASPGRPCCEAGAAPALVPTAGRRCYCW
jgi:hypothetical protein